MGREGKGNFSVTSEMSVCQTAHYWGLTPTQFRHHSNTDRLEMHYARLFMVVSENKANDIARERAERERKRSAGHKPIALGRR